MVFVGHTVISMQAELHGNHLLPTSVSQVASNVNPGGNMEGKETGTAAGFIRSWCSRCPPSSSPG